MSRPSLRLALIFLTGVPCFAQFGGNQSVFRPAGPVAQETAHLGWYLMIVLSITYLVTMAYLGYAIRQGQRANRPDARKGRQVVIAWGVVIPAAVLLSVLFYSVGVGRTLSVAPFKNSMTIQVTGKQWWWQVAYFHGSDMIAGTANEIHVPVGTPVKLKLSSTDVIHSFWPPSLHGKMDLIPGRTNETWIRADQEGVYRGQCAEYCGAQHAHMSFEIIAEKPEKFYQWLDWQRHPAVPPADATALEGQRVFLEGPCAMCHAIRGTIAGGSAGPDLTHLAGRRTIAAATLPNLRGHLGGWIVNAQGIKPGSNMPRINLEPSQLEPLLDYLETLK